MPTFTERVNAGLNNGYWAGSWFNSPSTTNMGNGSLGTVYAAWRFTSVTIPKGSIITSATLQLAADSNNSSDLKFKLFGIAEDNTADFSSDPGSRSKTSNNTAWEINTQTANTVYTSPDISAIIQEIVNRSGWSSGNALALISANNGTPVGTFQAKWAYNGNSSLAAFLTVTYSSPTTTHGITKSLQYTVKASHPISKLLRYYIYEENTNKVFSGMKVAKDGHNVIKTSLPDNLKFSSDYNTLKYLLNGHQSLFVDENTQKNGYLFFTAIPHNLGYYPLAIVYAKDNLMANYEPLGRFQLGSGASRSLFFYVTTTNLYVGVQGFYTTPTTYTIDFYYKIFANNLNI